MAINKSLLPIKAHYFIFWGTISSVLPFMMVVARQLGVPVAVQGTVSATIIGVSVFAKPLIAGIADSFPSLRKAIFLAILIVIVAAIGPIGVLPRLYDPPRVKGSLLQAVTGDLYLHTQDKGSCLVTVAWDCSASCRNLETCPLANLTVADLGLHIVHSEDVPLLHFYSDTHEAEEDFDYPDDPGVMTASVNKGLSNGTWIHHGLWSENPHYLIEGFPMIFDDYTFNISVECAGGERSGDGCLPPWMIPEFWLYIILLMVGKIASSTCYSVSNAICCDTIGKGGNYGSQRAWGALSYGLMGILSGLLVDWYSETSTVKDYTPAFLLMVVCGILDILLTAAYLRVPKLDKSSKVLVHIRPLLSEPHFLIFLGFSFLVGFYDSLDTGLQEDMARGSQRVMRHMKLLQGTTMLVQSFSAVPFMFVSDWFFKRLGAQKVLTLVLFLYAIRLFGLSLASALGSVWITIAIELINGPCFGLGFTAIIVHASNITPQGTSTTSQSVISVCYGTLGCASANLLGGLAYEALGGQNLYFITGLAALFTCLLHIIYLRFLPHLHDKEAGDIEPEKNAKAQLELQKVICSTCSTDDLDKKVVKYDVDVENGEKEVLPLENDLKQNLLGCQNDEKEERLQKPSAVDTEFNGSGHQDNEQHSDLKEGCGL